MSFSSLGLAERISSNVAALGYSAPTPIQKEAIPAVLSGRDLIGLAQTGTGKTAAFALPIIQKLSEAKSRAVRCLIVAPTRELAQQIVEAIKSYSEGTGLKSCAIYGGVRMGSQLKRLRDGVDIVVGCPGRLVDHVQRKTLDLSKVETLVLDEADHMFDMGFLPDIKKLVSYVPKQRQTLLFSATMPKEIRGLAEAVLTDPLSIKVSNGEMAATVTHALFPVSGDLKTQLLEKILKQFEVKSTIIFARTKMRTKRLADNLQKNGYRVACLQGNLSQQRRQDAITGFRDGKFDVLVATDLAARGIDVQQVTHVINFDIPMTVEGYTHRIGRTGRAAREGEAFTLISGEDEGKVRAIERHMGVKIERRKLDDFDYGKDQYSERAMNAGHSEQSTRRPRTFSRAASGSSLRGGAGRSYDRKMPRGEARSRSRDQGPRDSAPRTAEAGSRFSSERSETRYGARSDSRAFRTFKSDERRGRSSGASARFQSSRSDGRSSEQRADSSKGRGITDRHAAGFRKESFEGSRDGYQARKAGRSSDNQRSFGAGRAEGRNRSEADRSIPRGSGYNKSRSSERPEFNRDTYARKRGFGNREMSQEGGASRSEQSYAHRAPSGRAGSERSSAGSRSYGQRGARPTSGSGRSFNRNSGRSGPRGRPNRES